MSEEVSALDPQSDPDGFISESYERMKRASTGLPRRPIRHRGRRTRRTDQADEGVEEKEGFEGWTPPPGIARSLSGTGKSSRDPQTLGSVLKRTVARNRWRGPLSLGTIAAAWPEIVGTGVGQHSNVESLEDHRLLVRTDSTAWAKQLQLLIPQIEKRLDEVVGTGAVTQVVIHGPERPSWKHGLRSVPGRGPRDTYG